MVVSNLIDPSSRNRIAPIPKTRAMAATLVKPGASTFPFNRRWSAGWETPLNSASAEYEIPASRRRVFSSSYRVVIAFISNPLRSFLSINADDTFRPRSAQSYIV
jgi:hypothetical protein